MHHAFLHGRRAHDLASAAASRIRSSRTGLAALDGAAKIAQAAAGGVSLLRGETYLPAVIGTFGMWLVGFFLLLTSDAANPTAKGVYTLVLLGPISYLALVAFRGSNTVLKFAFTGVSLVVAALGLGFLLDSHAFAVAGGVFSLLTAPAAWYLAYERIMHGIEAERARHEDSEELELGIDRRQPAAVSSPAHR